MPYSRPVATLYIFRLKKRPVAIGLGQVPPDPGQLEYDSLLRIPVVANGNRPPWKMFNWNMRETMGAALKRSRWPDDDTPEEEDHEPDLHLL